MNEDLAAQVRMGVTYVLLSSAVIWVLVTVIIMSQQFGFFQQRGSSAVSHMQQGTLQQVNGKIMSAPAAYRILEEAQAATQSLTIRANGHTYYDYTILMEEEYQTKEFYFGGTSDAAGSWEITLTEK